VSVTPAYRVRFTRQAEKDIAKLSPRLRAKLIDIIRNRLAPDPRSGKPLVGPLKGCWSMRLSYQDRIVYRIEEDELLVLVLRTHALWGMISIEALGEAMELR
jgi:mRNA-degrading endonuclease RelE of RelBE toxin-antitoxin system